jgi:hypothetical protein
LRTIRKNRLLERLRDPCASPIFRPPCESRRRPTRRAERSVRPSDDVDDSIARRSETHTCRLRTRAGEWSRTAVGRRGNCRQAPRERCPDAVRPRFNPLDATGGSRPVLVRAPVR